MLGRTDLREPALAVVHDVLGASPDRGSAAVRRTSEAIPGTASWLTLLGPIWLSLVNPNWGFAFVSAFVAYFLIRGTVFGVRGLIKRRRILTAMATDWVAKLEAGNTALGWQQCRVTLLIRAFREGNVAMLRATLDAIYASDWPRERGLLQRVNVVFATEQHDAITPPIVDQLASDFRGRLVVSQVRHPVEPGTLPGPSTAMHFVGRYLYREAMRQGISPSNWIIADLDADTQLHPKYLACLVCRFVSDPGRQLRVYQPVVAFTTDYWKAPLHSRLSALGNTALTVSWNGHPEIAFTGAAASLALLRSVDFWPPNSHSQDSGIDLRLRMRYGRQYRVIGLPMPLRVYPVMAVGAGTDARSRVKAYLRRYATLFRQSARWREGPLDEFVEAVGHRHAFLMLHRLWNGLERDTVTILPGYGYIGAHLATTIFHPDWTLAIPGGGNTAFTIGSTIALSAASLIGLVLFWQLLGSDGHFVPRKPAYRRVAELLSFWVVFGVYIPILTGFAGLKTATFYLFGRRPSGHFSPTPK